jgi:hypothetical protein
VEWRRCISETGHGAAMYAGDDRFCNFCYDRAMATKSKDNPKDFDRAFKKVTAKSKPVKAR